jgi:uncharacterized metal-binding protein
VTSNLVLSLPLTYYGFFCQTWLEPRKVATITISFIVATLFFSPDLDLAHSQPTRNWGIFRPIWYCYPKLFRHRGSSHSFLFSSLSKLAYLALLISIFFGMFTFMFQLIRQRELNAAWNDSKALFWQAGLDSYTFLVQRRDLCIPILSGLVLSDWFHILTDRVFSLFGRLSFYRSK